MFTRFGTKVVVLNCAAFIFRKSLNGFLIAETFIFDCSLCIFCLINGCTYYVKITDLMTNIHNQFIIFSLYSIIIIIAQRLIFLSSLLFLLVDLVLSLFGEIIHTLSQTKQIICQRDQFKDPYSQSCLLKISSYFTW